MKTTVDIPEDRLDALMKLRPFGTRKDAINTAINAFVRDEKKKQLLALEGTCDEIMTQEELAAMRDDRIAAEHA